MMVSRCLIPKTGRDNPELNVNCTSVLVASVHKHRGGSQDALQMLLMLDLDSVEKLVQSFEFRCSWTAGLKVGRSPTTNTNIHSCKMAARNHSDQKYTL